MYIGGETDCHNCCDAVIKKIANLFIVHVERIHKCKILAVPCESILLVLEGLARITISFYSTNNAGGIALILPFFVTYKWSMKSRSGTVLHLITLPYTWLNSEFKRNRVEISVQCFIAVNSEPEEPLKTHWKVVKSYFICRRCNFS